MSSKVEKTCGDCAKYLSYECPRCEYKDTETNRAACSPADSICQEFQKKKGEKKLKPIYKDSGIADEGHFEATHHNDKPCFLVLKNNEFSLLETVNYNGKPLFPKEVNRIPYEPYGFFQGAISNREDLFWKVRREFQIFVDVEPIWLEVLSSCVLLSYQQEKLLTVPYIYLFGDNESGKSTVLQLLKFLCYRPMYGVTVPPADIYGYLEDSDAIGCILEDEVQGINKDTDKIKIYKAGYKQGAVVPRTIITQYDRKIKYYNTFCFKACASEQIPQVKGFRERFIEIGMIEGFPEKEWTDLTQEDLKRLHDLRNMLLKWRMLSREWQLPNPEVSMRGRLKELWKPILQITHGLSIYETLASFVEEQRDERIATKQNTLEGHIVKVVTELHKQAGENPIPYIPFQTIWLALAEDLDGKLDDKKPHVMDTSEFFQVTKSKVGYRLREILSGKSKTVREKIEGEKDENCPRIKVYDFDQDKLRRVAKKYGYQLVTKLPIEKPDSNILVTKLLSEPSSEGVQAPISTLKNHENNVEKSHNAPLEVGALSNSVTKPKSIDEMFNLEPLSFDALNFRDGPHQLPGEMLHYGECYRCKQTTQITGYYSDFKGNKQDLCTECLWAVSKELEKRHRGISDEKEDLIDRAFSTPKKEIPKTQSEKELERILHATWQRGTTEAFYKLIHEKTGWSRNRIADSVAKLIEEAKITYNSEGLLIWVDCRNCGFFKLENEQASCKLSSTLLDEETFSQGCDDFEEKTKE